MKLDMLGTWDNRRGCWEDRHTHTEDLTVALIVVCTAEEARAVAPLLYTEVEIRTAPAIEILSRDEAPPVPVPHLCPALHKVARIVRRNAPVGSEDRAETMRLLRAIQDGIHNLRENQFATPRRR